MDEILSALIALIHWRLIFCTIGSIALAVVFSNLLVFFTAGYCVALVLLGVVFGIVWQARVDKGTRHLKK